MKSKVQSPRKSKGQGPKAKAIEMRGGHSGSGNPQPALVLCSVFGEPGGRNTAQAPRNSKRASEGVALVITLILLSVITFMAITFLVVSRGEKSTVGSVTEQTTAR